MSAGQVRASRVRKCRFAHQCPACRQMITVGSQEGLVSIIS